MPKRITKGNLWGLIQSRPYTLVSDVRRAFALQAEDAVAVATPEGRAYVGLPQVAADLVRQLYLEGRVILDLHPEVRGRVVAGLFPARPPIVRQRATPALAAAVPYPGPAAGQPESGRSAGPSRQRRRRRRTASAGERPG